MRQKKTNLLIETIDALLEHDKAAEDVRWVGGQDHYMSWEQYASIAQHVNYDSPRGSQKINDDLVVAGDDWWLERDSDDWDEAWVYKTQPVKPQDEMAELRVISSVLRKTRAMKEARNEHAPTPQR